LTDEQLASYLDSAATRIRQKRQVDFEDAIEAVRAGTIVAHDAKAYNRWKTDVTRRSGGADTRQGLRALKLAAGGNVTTDGFEFRN